MSDGKPEKLRPEDLRAEDLVIVWNAPDEVAATAVCDFLRDQGVEAMAVAVQIPWFGGVETLHHGYWGRVEVLSHDAARARALIEDFFKATPEPEPEPEPEPGEPEGDVR